MIIIIIVVVIVSKPKTFVNKVTVGGGFCNDN
jgi:hypothetical protein